MHLILSLERSLRLFHVSDTDGPSEVYVKRQVNDVRANCINANDI